MRNWYVSCRVFMRLRIAIPFFFSILFLLIIKEEYKLRDGERRKQKQRREARVI